MRVYPDRIHIDSHEAELTPAENTWGQHYWTQIWNAGDDTQAQMNAWRQLADRYDRAACGMDCTTAAADEYRRFARRLRLAPQFPRVDVVEEGKDAAWRSAPKARLLPTRWVAIVQAGGRAVAAAAGRDIRPDLAVGPDPQVDQDENAPEIPGDQPAVDAGMRWMVDFDEAEAAGMGLRIPITAATLARASKACSCSARAASAPRMKVRSNSASSSTRSTTRMAWSSCEFGTPSNNTTAERSGYGAEDVGHERSFATESGAVEVTLDAQSNAQRVGSALGLPAADIAPVLASVSGGSDRHEIDLRSMNTALWQTTWGYFLTT